MVAWESNFWNPTILFAQTASSKYTWDKKFTIFVNSAYLGHGTRHGTVEGE